MSQSNEIRLLSKELAGKIAAGEVVERPLSIVKELVENAVDAGARQITVEIGKGGKEYIRVTDDGGGIAADQVELAFRRHATSKIRTEEDLGAIRTLGFRGEALASIAAVSRTELITRVPGERTGTRISFSASESEGASEAACDEGTTIVVRDLFFNVPARRKFLKSDGTESALIIDFVSKMAIAFPAVRMRLINNRSILFSTLGNGDLLKAIQTVYGSDAGTRLLPVSRGEGALKLAGYVSAPGDYRRHRKYQIFFVNGRLIRSKLLERSLDEAYRDKMFEGEYPSAFLFLSTDPASVDVNIHPHKTEIRFYDEESVSYFMIRSLREALLDPESSARRHEDISAELSEPGETPSETEVEPPPKTVDLPFVYRAEDELFSRLRTERNEEETASLELQEELPETNYGEKSKRFLFSSLTYIGQVFGTYLLAKDEAYLYMLDQHAAHERVLYEQLLARFNEESPDAQTLLMPYIVQLSAARKASALEKLPLLRSIGYEVEDFGPGELVIKAVPSCMSLEEAEAFLEEAINAEGGNIQAKRDRIISASCKAAIKGNRDIKPEEVRALFASLDLCENPYSCPHGRPTFIRLSDYELDKLFRRK